MRFIDLESEPDCRNGGSTHADAAIGFQTDDGPVVLPSGASATGVIDGRKFQLQAFKSVRIRHDESVSDGASSAATGMIARLPD